MTQFFENVAQDLASKTKSKLRLQQLLTISLSYENSASSQDTFTCFLFINLPWMNEYHLCFQFQKYFYFGNCIPLSC